MCNFANESLDKVSCNRCLQFCETSLHCHKIEVIENVSNEWRLSEKQWEKHCKMTIRTAVTAVTNRFGEGFSLLGNKGSVGVTDGISGKLCHAVQN